MGVQEIVIAGAPVQSGAYVLRIHLTAPLALAIGRYRRGEPVAFPAGDCVYVGSAMGRRGATTLAGRLIRHATRTEGSPPHAIRLALVEALAAAGLGKGDRFPRTPKRCHWHVDYLLERPEAEIVQVFALRSERRCEREIARLLSADPQTFVIAPGLGACDAPGGTHLLGIRASADWWSDLVTRVNVLGTDQAISH